MRPSTRPADVVGARGVAPRVHGGLDPLAHPRERLGRPYEAGVQQRLVQPAASRRLGARGRARARRASAAAPPRRWPQPQPRRHQQRVLTAGLVGRKGCQARPGATRPSHPSPPSGCSVQAPRTGGVQGGRRRRVSATTSRRSVQRRPRNGRKSQTLLSGHMQTLVSLSLSLSLPLRLPPRLHVRPKNVLSLLKRPDRSPDWQAGPSLAVPEALGVRERPDSHDAQLHLQPRVPRSNPRRRQYHPCSPCPDLPYSPPSCPFHAARRRDHLGPPRRPSCRAHSIGAAAQSNAPRPLPSRTLRSRCAAQQSLPARTAPTKARPGTRGSQATAALQSA